MTSKKALTTLDLINEAIKDYKNDNPDWKKDTREEMYCIESYIDSLLYKKKFKHISPGYWLNILNSNDEVIL